MTHLFYILESILCCGLLYALYKLFIEGRVAHRFSALYIMVTALLGLIIPALELPLYPAQVEEVAISATEVASEPIGELPIETEPLAPLSTLAKPQNEPMEINFAVILWALYVIVALLNLLRLVWNWYQVRKIYRSSQLESFGDYTLALNDQIRDPFSFGHTVYINSQLQGSERNLVLSHELSHLLHRHTLERISLEFLRSLSWFNPFLWFYCSSLSEVHEWEADQDVLSQGYDVTEYRKIIFRQLFGYNPDIACGLHNHKTPKRFIMMTSFIKDKLSFMRLCAVIPLVMVMILVFGSVRAEAVDSSQSIESVSSENIAQDQGKFNIYISADGKITLNGKVVTNDELRSSLEKMRAEMGASSMLIIKADSNARVGLIHDVKAAARAANVLRIKYDVPLGGQMTVERVLPPQTTIDPNARIPVVEHIADRNLLTLYINSLGWVLTTRPDGTEGVVDKVELKSIIKAFVDNSESVDGKQQVKNSNYADFTWQTISRDTGEVHYPVSNGVISLVTVRDTPSDKYMEILEVIIAAYAELREELAQRSFSKSFEELDLDQRRFVMRAIPVKVSEQDTTIRE